MDPQFTTPDTWTGGFYELGIVPHAHDDATAAACLAALWGSPYLFGCFLDRDRDAATQVQLLLANLPIEGHLYGVATFADGRACVCGTYTTLFPDDGRWLRFYLPLTALATCYPLGGYPFGAASPALAQTLHTLNEWLRVVAEHVYHHCPFTLGVIGFETDLWAASALAQAPLSEPRWDGLLLPTDGSLRWYPPTEYGPQWT